MTNSVRPGVRPSQLTADTNKETPASLFFAIKVSVGCRHLVRVTQHAQPE